MKRGELYRVAKPLARDPKRFRVFVIVSRQALIESRYSTVICAPDLYELQWFGDTNSGWYKRRFETYKQHPL